MERIYNIINIYLHVNNVFVLVSNYTHCYNISYKVFRISVLVVYTSQIKNV